MKEVFILISLNLVSIIFAIGSIFMATHGVSGWGWMIGASILTYSWTKRYEYE